MPKVCNLIQVTEEEREAILKHHNVTEREFTESLNLLRDWLVKSGLPVESNADMKLKTAFLNCKMSIERTKECIRGYYRIRTVHADFFDRLLPYTEDYEMSKKLARAVKMPRLSPDLCRITIFKSFDPNGEATDGMLYIVTAIMEAEMTLMSDDFFLSHTLIIDMEHFRFKTLIKFTPTVCQRLINLMLGIKLRLKNIHFINSSPMFDQVMVLVKTFLPSNMQQKVCTHKYFESLYEYIPKEYLPLDYGGDQPSIDELNEEWCSLLESREEDFKNLLQAKCKDTLQTTITSSDMFGIGSEGSFKKLSTD